jgi:ribosomal protein S18 acetylase RimI-like enzyme
MAVRGGPAPGTVTPGIRPQTKPVCSGCPPGVVAAAVEPFGAMSGFVLRPASDGDVGFLTEMLFEAANWSGLTGWPRDAILRQPAIGHYIAGWMRSSDLGVVALELDGPAIGAAWLRQLTGDDPGYGYVADDIPELSIAVVKQWRGHGVGEALLRALLHEAGERGLRAVSLSVERANRASQLYVREGFRVVESFGDSDTMLAWLTPQSPERPS